MVKIKNALTQKIFTNLVCALIIGIYFIFFSLKYTNLDITAITQYIRLSCVLFLGLSIIMMEIAYKKENGLLFFNGLEFSAIAIFVLLTQYLSKTLNCTIQVYTLTGGNFVAIYYILKSAILYTKEQQEKLNSLSDIKEIVKDEPIKKATKRKNKK